METKGASLNPASQPQLPPGFRFHPTDEELLIHYLKNKVSSSPLPVSIIADVDLYKFDPWDLPRMACFGEKEWYFFSPMSRKYPNGDRPNRAAVSGYWKATGTDKPVVISGTTHKVGVRKTLVFYRGKAPKGIRTNWIMHEYRLTDAPPMPARRKGSLRLDWVLCRIYKKASYVSVTEESRGEAEDSTTESLNLKNSTASAIKPFQQHQNLQQLSHNFDSFSWLQQRREQSNFPANLVKSSDNSRDLPDEIIVSTDLVSSKLNSLKRCLSLELEDDKGDDDPYSSPKRPDSSNNVSYVYAVKNNLHGSYFHF